MVLDVFRNAGGADASTGPTVAKIWEAYRLHLGDRPTAANVGYLGKAVLSHFGAYRPDQISIDMCRDYTALRMKAGRKQGTAHTELGHLRSALTFAQKAKMIEKAPHIERPVKPMPKERYLTHAEVAHLIDCAATPHIRLAIQLLFCTAGRVGAILDLSWDRVDFAGGQINLRLSDAVTRKGRAIVPMNRSLRAALSVAREAALTDHVIEYAGQRVACIRTGFFGTLRRAGIKDACIHTIRHSAAVHMVQQGVPMDKVAQFLGHSNSSITYSTYARFSPKHLADASEVLDFPVLKVVGGGR